MTAAPKPTPELTQQITAFIRAGSYPHVAAEAAGVPRETFEAWMNRGRRSRRPPYGPFYRAVCQAQGQVRARAEIAALAQDARFWLRHGPGKESVDNPGWSSPVKAASRDERSPTDWSELIEEILRILAPFPEARAALADALADARTGRPNP
ncbi:MAG: hypothetical protein NZ700_11455 [Gemmataceae bacterium]|nr:hypothetical protein [Gemmataceae bacterium]MDW8265150.1 hypothetical protein [Gemmataceae bacterium]